MTPRTRQIFHNAIGKHRGESVLICPTCNRKFSVWDCGIADRLRQGLPAPPRTKVFCKPACKQKAYRARALQRNTAEQREVDAARYRQYMRKGSTT